MMQKILVVEDDVFSRKLYFDILNISGYSVDFAIDGEEALLKIKQGGYDLILLDILLPRMSGLEVIKQMQKEPSINPNKKIVFLTNLDNVQELDETRELGYDSLIKSEMTPDVFLEKVKEYLVSSK